MRIVRAIICTTFYLLLQPVVLAQGAPSSCDAIAQLDGQVMRSRSQLSNLLLQYTERHPFVVEARKNLEKLETALTEQVALAKSKGIVCPSPESQRKKASSPL